MVPQLSRFKLSLLDFQTTYSISYFLTCKKQFQVIREIMEIFFALGLERIRDVKTEYSLHCREN